MAGTWEFAVTAGSPREVRTTNVPAITSWGFALGGNMVTYANYLSLLRNEGSIITSSMGIESAADGRLYFNREQSGVLAYTETNIWTDAYTGYFVLAGRFGSSLQEVYVQRLGGAWTQAVATATAFSYATVELSLCCDTQFLPDMNGTFRWAFLHIFNTTPSVAELQQAVIARQPPVTTGITFANRMLSATQPNVDESGTGGNFTQTGTPTFDTTESPAAMSSPGWMETSSGIMVPQPKRLWTPMGLG